MLEFLKERLSSVINSFSKQEDERIRLSLGLAARAKGIVFGELELGERDVDGMLRELETALIEGDVAYEVAEAVVSDVRKRLVGMRVKSGEAGTKAKEAVREVLLEQMSEAGPDLLTLAQERKPLKILFVGPNGAGKTTTMAKVAHLLMRGGLSVVFSASDSYRAAAIEQTEEHAKRLGVKVIKHVYGADPAAVCFDAINYATAHKIDAVLMDSAGRQETNRNLIDEMRKMVRVAKPDLKIFVGESIAGNAIVEQAREFHKAIHLDGVILTKLDADPKGGTAISIARAVGVPVLFVGTGQGYDDLKPFDPRAIVDSLL